MDQEKVEAWQEASAPKAGGSGHSFEWHVAEAKKKREQPRAVGCAGKFCGFLRSCWATPYTEKGASKEDLIKVNIRELFVYIVFLVTALVITFDMTSSTYYYYSKAMQDLFLDSETATGASFRDLGTIDDWWSYVADAHQNPGDKSPFMNGIYWDKWYTGENITANQQNYIFYENKVLGVPRIRQVRVRPDSCSINADFTTSIDTCYGEYGDKTRDTEEFGDPTIAAFKFSSEKDLEGSNHKGWLGYSYDGSGYVQDLYPSRSDSATAVAELKENKWLDRQTRAVFIDFSVYNANVNLFCVVRLVTEFPASGGAVSSWNFRTVKMLSNNTEWDNFVKVLMIFYMVLIGYYVIEEFLEIWINGCGYLGEFWNLVDICIVVCSILACGFKVYQENTVSSKISVLTNATNTYPDFEYISYWTEQYIQMVAITVFLCWIKLFKFISFNKTLRQLQSTLARCALDIAGFFVMFIIIFVAYAQLGYLTFGSAVPDFYTFWEAVYTLFRIILGDFNFHALERANSIFGPIYFISYVVLVFFILLNMFLAIINDTYSEVKADMALQESDFEISDYIKKGYDKVLRKLHLRKDHLDDLHEATHTADTNRDKRLDFDEWKRDLKIRGIPENEIEAVFARYDADGDNVLDEQEQRQLRLSLERQKAELREKINDVDVGLRSNAPTESSIFGEGNSEEIITKLTKHFVGQNDFMIVSKRIDRLEKHVQAVSAKLDGIIVKLDEKERVSERKRDNLTRVIDRELSDNSSMSSATTKTSSSRVKSAGSSVKLRQAPEPPMTGTVDIAPRLPQQTSQREMSPMRAPSRQELPKTPKSKKSKKPRENE